MSAGSFEGALSQFTRHPPCLITSGPGSRHVRNPKAGPQGTHEASQSTWNFSKGSFSAERTTLKNHVRFKNLLTDSIFRGNISSQDPCQIQQSTNLLTDWLRSIVHSVELKGSTRRSGFRVLDVANTVDTGCFPNKEGSPSKKRTTH